VSLRVLLGKSARSRDLDQLAHGAVGRGVALRCLSLPKGETSVDVVVEEGVDTAAVSMSKAKVAQEDRVDLRHCVTITIQDCDRPGASTDEHTVWSASFSSRLQVGGVEGGVSSRCEDQGPLRVDNNLLPLLGVRFPPG
jgi:hypothetical protein